MKTILTKNYNQLNTREKEQFMLYLKTNYADVIGKISLDTQLSKHNGEIKSFLQDLDTLQHTTTPKPSILLFLKTNYITYVKSFGFISLFCFPVLILLYAFLH